MSLRRSLLGKSPRAMHVLDLATAKASWGTPLPVGKARGASLQSVMGSFVATVATVAVADDGTFKVESLVTAINWGTVINPDTVVAQVQGGLLFGLTAALYGEITIDRGRVKQSNFDDYRSLGADQFTCVPRPVVAFARIVLRSSHDDLLRGQHWPEKQPVEQRRSCRSRLAALGRGTRIAAI